VLCTSGGLYGALVLARLLRSPDVTLAGIVRSTRVLHPAYGWARGALAQLRRSGADYTLYLGLATTVTDLAGTAAPLPSVAVAARRQRIPLHATRDINDQATGRFLAAQQPELLVSAFFNQKIGEAVCTMPTLGAVNIHPSLLPDFRGVDPVFFARLRGATELGVSLHRVTEAFDTGPILDQAVVAMPAGESLLAATARLFVRGAGCLIDSLPAIRAGAPGRPQSAGGRYDSWPTPDQVRAYRTRGGCLARVADLGLLGRRGLSLLDGV